MKFKYYSFRYSNEILDMPNFAYQKEEIFDIIDSITERDLIIAHNFLGVDNISSTPKSLSIVINKLLKSEFINRGWLPEAPIFQNNNYQGEVWRLDFAKKDISIEIAFNHSGSIAWNLLKPVLAGELNHVEKHLQTKIGVIITATEELKKQGGFDGAIGTYEKFIDYLKPLNNILSIPILIIGLDKMESFELKVIQYEPRKKIGIIKYL